ncbi:hypothetical protein NDU88_007024 [Pleurodeles waltl]|uniref:Uncharacterized protein n=1 Tax=Pleurodeles waltl TaxID=8319 RepID=A0AAV7WGG0_PLEWA|nr:hypothetical protein NDU88_007024 [Pleurodeles waltl]
MAVNNPVRTCTKLKPQPPLRQRAAVIVCGVGWCSVALPLVLPRATHKLCKLHPLTQPTSPHKRCLLHSGTGPAVVQPPVSPCSGSLGLSFNSSCVPVLLWPLGCGPLIRPAYPSSSLQLRNDTMMLPCAQLICNQRDTTVDRSNCRAFSLAVRG